MTRERRLIVPMILCCTVLGACGSTQKKTDVLDLYQLPSGARPVIDNDSYYSQPGGIKACTTINDAPSCGGG